MSREFDGRQKNLHWLTDDEWRWVQQLRAANVCSTKKPYESKNQAYMKAVQRKLNSPQPFPKLRAYLCDVCNKWHLTSWKSRESRE